MPLTFKLVWISMSIRGTSCWLRGTTHRRLRGAVPSTGRNPRERYKAGRGYLSPWVGPLGSSRTQHTTGMRKPANGTRLSRSDKPAPVLLLRGRCPHLSRAHTGDAGSGIGMRDGREHPCTCARGTAPHRHGLLVRDGAPGRQEIEEGAGVLRGFLDLRRL